MKKVVFEAVEVVVCIDDINNSDHVGIQWKSNAKGMVVEVDKGYCIMNNDIALKVGSIHNPSKREYLKDRFINKDIKEVYVFRTYKELLTWFTS